MDLEVGGSSPLSHPRSQTRCSSSNARCSGRRGGILHRSRLLWWLHAGRPSKLWLNRPTFWEGKSHETNRTLERCSDSAPGHGGGVVWSIPREQANCTFSLADCCLDPNCPPGCCEECLPDCLLTITAEACCPESECCPDGACCVTAASAEKTAGFTCPLTGEELACPNCCPLNQK